MPKKPHTLIAQHLGMDSAEVNEYRYHYGHTKRPVYAIGDEYYTSGRAMPTELGLDWVVDGIQEGINIYKAKHH